ncbi:MAG: UbiD family decarboxylase [Pseudoxanthomonas sp.]|nr:UbiD family decarboxylase [Pseudoxanthomonas sp.]
MHDLRVFLDRLRSRGDLMDVHAPVDPALEATALSLAALKADGPASLMHRPLGSRHPMLGNLFGHRRRIELALGDRPVGSLRELGRLLASIREPRWPGSLKDALSQWPELAQLAHVAPREVHDAAFNDEVIEGDAIDLGRLPIQTCWPGDAGPLITFGLVVTRGPTKRRENVAIYRQQPIGPRRVIMRWLAHRGGALDYQDHLRVHPDQPFPVVVAIGVDPATALAAVAPIPDTLSEFEFAGLLRGSRSRVWRSALTGLHAPAGAEIVMEGFIHPGDTALEGPFGDHTGHTNAQGTYPVLTVERLRIRRDALYQGSYMGRPPWDEPSVLAEALNDVFVPLLQKVFPEIVDFYLPPAACSYRIALVSIRKQYPGHARRIMLGIWSYLRQFTYTKAVAVFDDDIDLRNGHDVLWALSTRVDPARDSLVMDRTPVDVLDFSSPEPNLGGKIGIDATRKTREETGRAWSPVLRPDPAVQARMDALYRSLRAPNH